VSPKLYLQAAIAIAIGLFCWWAYDAIGDAREDAVVARYEKEFQKQKDAALAKEKSDRDELNRKSEEYEQQIIDLRKHQPPVPVVRVRKCPVQTSGSTASAPSESSQAPSDGLDRENGRDIGPDFRAYAIDCKAVAIQLKQVIEAWPK